MQRQKSFITDIFSNPFSKGNHTEKSHYEKKLYVKELPFYLNIKQLRKFRLVIQTILIVFLFVIGYFIFFQYHNPSGIIVHYATDDANKNISDFVPKERVNLFNDNGQTIVQQKNDLLYFSVNMPFDFDTATVRITFQNQSPDQDLIMGFKDITKKNHFTTQLIDSSMLKSLSWEHIGTGPVLYQRQKKYATMDEFMKNPPKGDIIGIYNYNPSLFPNSETQLADYHPASTEAVLDTPLRGKHTLYVYLQNEPFIFNIAKQDLNWYDGSDPVSISVYKGTTLISQQEIPDDGIVDNSGKTLYPQQITIKSSGSKLPKNGVYKIVINANSDTVIKRITTNLHKIVFEGPLNPIANKAYGSIIASTSATTLTTDALDITAAASHPQSLQNILIGTQTLPLTSLQRTIGLVPTDTISTVTIPKSDVLINGMLGYFSLQKDQFFRPTPYYFLPIKQPDDIDLTDYLLTNYDPPQKDGKWEIAERTFDLSRAAIVNKQLTWIIQAPNLYQNAHIITIKKIDIVLHKNPIL